MGDGVPAGLAGSAGEDDAFAGRTISSSCVVAGRAGSYARARICATPRAAVTRRGMRGAIGGDQPGAVDGGVDLGRRQRGVAEQLLDRAQIAAARQQVGGEGMAQRVRRGAVGQAERAAQPLPSPVGRCAATAARPWRRRTAGLAASAHRGRARDSRRSPACTGAITGAERVLRPLPTTVDRVALADRRVGAADRQRFADAQARAVAQRQHGGVAREDPRLARFARRAKSAEATARASAALSGRGRRRAALGARTAPSAEAGARPRARRGAPASARRRARAAASARRFPRRGGARERRAGRPARGRENSATPAGAPKPLGEKGEKLAHVAPVGLQPIGRKPPLAGEPAKPGRDDRRQIGRGGQGGVVEGVFGAQAGGPARSPSWRAASAVMTKDCKATTVADWR